MMKLLPMEYAIRNLGRSKVRLALSVGGGVLVVLLVLAAAGFVTGMERSLTGMGQEGNAILLGAGSEESLERSEIEAGVPGLAAGSIRGIKVNLGVPLVSPEVHMQVPLGMSKMDASPTMMLIRGVTPAAVMVHSQVRLTHGRLPEVGRDELMIGRSVAARMGVEGASLMPGGGAALWFDGRPWTIVGQFEAPGTAMESEVWTPLSDLMIAARRKTLSCVILTLDKAEFADVDSFAKQQQKLELVAVRETDYYQGLSAFYRPVRAMVWITAGLIAVGGLFGGLNTMFAAFASRVREIGMLQSLGYSRRAIVVSFMQESLLTAAAGAILGAAIGLSTLDRITVKFSAGAFGLSMDAATLSAGLLAGLALGLVGALPPAWRSVRLPIAEALKSA